MALHLDLNQAMAALEWRRLKWNGRWRTPIEAPASSLRDVPSPCRLLGAVSCGEARLLAPKCPSRPLRSEGVEKAEENGEIGTPGEQPKTSVRARAKDLRRHEDQAVDEGPELHAQHAFAFGLVLTRQRDRWAA
ncbi:MAG: hypothetical protein IPM79_37185 [Polyangiaceae bacterium]|nr:hypothetical protein [Polyangiaceae bacterium]